jgi:hypothetical protein
MNILRGKIRVVFDINMLDIVRHFSLELFDTHNGFLRQGIDGSR